ncbi:MAG: hypothetical protein Q8R91_05085 [Candidatus Omnitrophota bacterium]|nr:hypothetical protein [Candidatus Omnitrophota bacterium]
MGYLDAMLDAHDTGWDAWRYLSYAVQTYPTHQSVQRKLKKLSEKRPDTSSDIFQHRRYESEWKAARLEFRALYALTRFFGYQFVDFDGKAPSASGNDDCDLVLSRSGDRTKFVYAEVKCWCFPERSQVPDPSCSILRRYNPVPKADPVNVYSPLEDGVPDDPGKIGRWLEDRLEDVTKKGAEVLVCDLSEDWTWENLEVGCLREYCDQILPGKLRWQSDGPIWAHSVPVTTVEKIVVVRRIGCWSIALRNSKAG